MTDIKTNEDGLFDYVPKEDAIVVDDRALREHVARKLGIQASYLRANGPPIGARGSIALYGMRISLERCEWTDRSFNAEVTVPDRETGQPLRLFFNQTFDPCRTEEDLATGIIKGLANLIAHELAEMLFIQGERFDPHLRPVFFDWDERMRRPERPRIPDLPFEFTMDGKAIR